ncbi:MAG: JAB domain-containing protein [Gramella sp.]|nr:JAB domain-containing protein [Christiangramia sp.]
MRDTIAEIQLKYHPFKHKNTKITCSNDAYSFLRDNWNLDTIELQEEFKLLLLNRANEILGIHVLSKGGMTGTMVDIRLVFAVVLKSAACSFIMAHNHPSGNLKPSESDRNLYRKIKSAAEFMDIQVLDNLIITKAGYLSFADEGIL